MRNTVSMHCVHNYQIKIGYNHFKNIMCNTLRSAGFSLLTIDCDVDSIFDLVSALDKWSHVVTSSKIQNLFIWKKKKRCRQTINSKDCMNIWTAKKTYASVDKLYAVQSFWDVHCNSTSAFIIQDIQTKNKTSSDEEKRNTFTHQY